MFWLFLSQADLDITEINKLTAEAIQTPLKSTRSEYFSKSLVELRELASQGDLSDGASSLSCLILSLVNKKKCDLELHSVNYMQE